MDGYLHLEGALTPTEVGHFSTETDRIRLLPGWEPGEPINSTIGHYTWQPHAKDTDPEGFMDRRDLLPPDQSFINLIERAQIFDLIVDSMGPHLLLSMTQAIVRQSTAAFPGYIHTDGGEALREISVTETSRPMAMKALYLLSDVNGDNASSVRYGL